MTGARTPARGAADRAPASPGGSFESPCAAWGWATALLMALLGGALPAFAAPPGPASAGPHPKNTCIECHRQLDRPELVAPARGFPQDVHAGKGLGCVGCHGGDPNDPEETAMDPDKGFKWSQGRVEIAEMCTSCHSDAAFMKRYNPQPFVFSMPEFQTSVHWKRISAGDVKAATCTSCHGLHGILPHTDPRSPVYHRNVPTTCAKCHNAQYMAGRALPTDQFTKYKTSVHGQAVLERGDPGAPACNNCHGNHGAAPPDVSDIDFVCGRCHGREGELFMKSKVSHALVLEGRRGCVTCHGNHGIQHPTDGMLTQDRSSTCHRCHTPGSPCDVAATSIVGGFNALKNGIGRADSLLTVADRMGMLTDAGREALKTATDQLTATRSSLHSFDRPAIEEVIAEGRAAAAKAEGVGREALRDWRIRRIGLALSLVVILGLIGVLVVKIRQVERTT